MFQIRQAKKDCEVAQNAMEQMIRECYRILMIPEQITPNKVGFVTRRIQTSSATRIANIVEKTLLEGEFIIQKWSSKLMNDHLTKHYFKDGKMDVSARKVWQDCCDYHQMPRILNESVFEQTMIDGVGKGDYFGFADGKDGDKYLGFKLGDQVFNLGMDDQALLIEHGSAVAYKEAHAPKSTPAPGFQLESESGTDSAQPVSGNGGGTMPQPTAPQEKKYRKFYGTAELKNTNASVSFEIQNLISEIVMPMAKLPGVTVKMKLDIEVVGEMPFDANTIRAVKENSTALKLLNSEFSDD